MLFHLTQRTAIPIPHSYLDPYWIQNFHFQKHLIIFYQLFSFPVFLFTAFIPKK